MLGSVDSVATFITVNDGWVGFTALQHNIGYIAAPVSVVNVRMSAHAGLVGSYHLAPSNSGWILLPHPTGGLLSMNCQWTVWIDPRLMFVLFYCIFFFREIISPEFIYIYCNRRYVFVWRPLKVAPYFVLSAVSISGISGSSNSKIECHWCQC